MSRVTTEAFLALIPRLEKLFPDYVVTGCDPGFSFASRNPRFYDNFTIAYRAALWLCENTTIVPKEPECLNPSSSPLA